MRARVLTQTRTLTNEEREVWQRKGITGRDIAAICGADRWRTSLEVYLEKIGQSPPGRVTEPMRIGREIKSFIAQRFAEQTGFRTHRRNMIYQHVEHDFLLATMDRWVVGDDAGLLCRSVGEYRKQEWQDGRIPQETQLQCQHLMAVTDTGHWWVAALIGGNKLHIVRVERSEAQIERLVKDASQFWTRHVNDHVQPEVDGSDAARELLGRMYGPDSAAANRIVLPDEAGVWVKQYRTACEEERITLRKKTEAENYLKALLGANESGVIGSDRVEWRTVQHKNGARQYRRFAVYKEQQVTCDAKQGG